MLHVRVGAAVGGMVEGGLEEGEDCGGSQVGKGVEEEEEEEGYLLTGAVLERGRHGKHVRLGETREGKRGGNARTLYTLALPPVEGSRAFTWAGVYGQGTACKTEQDLPCHCPPRVQP